ncbi:type I-E CRISPR-associated protein Cse2/CasB [Marinobacter fonticola]|uniref:type I-E CRISPR-associated protein Cse2/CasB n=1 Tax=Marinobacter fonticola TaxID=2603215 RepID=UPI0019310568|nr:type I-E CRISPR-associated protein Cse2/CasB [Marinobacter fonticola]
MNAKKRYYRILRHEYLQKQVLAWWARLHGDKDMLERLEWPGDRAPYTKSMRAELKHCGRVDDVLLTEAFRTLWFSLGDRETYSTNDMLAWATVAAVVATIRTHDESRSFAAALGSQKEKTGKPHVSELRFAQLQKSGDADTFLRRCRRAVALLGNQANVMSVADSVLHWHTEKQGYSLERADQRLAVRWATDYFTALAEYQK